MLNISRSPANRFSRRRAIRIIPASARARAIRKRRLTTSDISNGLKALNLADRSTFTTKDFSNGKGVMLAYMVIANGDATGSSPDYANGPIIPNNKYPIRVHGQTHQNGANFDSASDFPVPAVTTLDPKFAGVDGASHFPFFFFDNGDFATDPKAPLTGNYDFDITMTDKSGAGIALLRRLRSPAGRRRFPLPASFWPGMVLLAGLLAAVPLAQNAADDETVMTPQKSAGLIAAEVTLAIMIVALLVATWLPVMIGASPPGGR